VSVGTSRSTAANRATAIRALAAAGAVAAVAYFILRGPLRGINESFDLTYGYAAAQAWSSGLNPYDATVLEANMIAAQGPVVPMAIGHGVYLPFSIPLFTPIAPLPWQPALMLGLIVNVGCAFAIALGLVHLLGLRRSSTHGLVLFGFIMALGPIHTTVAAGQTGVVATAGLVGAMVLEQSKRDRWAGAVYGLASAVKAQIGLPFVLWALCRRRWAVGGLAGLVIGGLTLLALGRMAAANVAWLDSWLANLAWLTGPEGNGDPDPSNPDRFSLINLEYPLRVFLPEPWAGRVVLLVVGCAALATLALIRRRRLGDELLGVSLVAVLSLLVTYHRYYDAVVLALPIAWGISVLATPLRNLGLAVLVTGGAFIVPSLGALRELELAGHLPSWLTDNAVWAGLVLPHHTWAVVLIGVILLAAAWRTRSLNAGGAALPELVHDSIVDDRC
jgi:hypothetical protein